MGCSSPAVSNSPATQVRGGAPLAAPRLIARPPGTPRKPLLTAKRDWRLLSRSRS